VQLLVAQLVRLRLVCLSLTLRERYAHQSHPCLSTAAQVLRAYAHMASAVRADVEVALGQLLELVGEDPNCVPALLALSRAFLLLRQPAKARNQLKVQRARARVCVRAHYTYMYAQTRCSPQSLTGCRAGSHHHHCSAHRCPPCSALPSCRTGQKRARSLSEPGSHLQTCTLRQANLILHRCGDAVYRGTWHCGVST
jgi:hypothetical protein